MFPARSYRGKRRQERTTENDRRDLPAAFCNCVAYKAACADIKLPRWLVGFEAPPLAILVGTGIIVIGYLVSTELLKPLAVAQTGRADIEVNRTGLA